MVCLIYFINECISIKIAYTKYNIKVILFLSLSKNAITIPIMGKHKKNLTEVINNILFTMAQSFFLLYHTYIL